MKPLPTRPVPGMRLALLADVHGNVPALAACLAEIQALGVDAIAFLGCLTWGPEPRRTLDLARSTGVPAYFLRGNGERAVLELAAGQRAPASAVDAWMVEAHGDDVLRELASFPEALSAPGLPVGPARMCHGSPRSDIELLTPATSQARLREAFGGVPESVVCHGHTHLQYQRRAVGKLVVGVGSVGLPYATGGRPGARWTLLDAAAQQRITGYDMRAATDAVHSTGFPGAERYLRTLAEPPTLEQMQADAEARLFSD